MNRIIVSLLLVIAVSSCFNSVKKNSAALTTNQKATNDTSHYAIIALVTGYDWIFKNAVGAELTEEEINQVFQFVNKAVEDHNKKLPGFLIQPLEEYRFQFVPVINSKGEKEVWVNSFCNTPLTDWRTRIVEVDDGGSCFFQLKVNLTQKKYYEMGINGVA